MSYVGAAAFAGLASLSKAIEDSVGAEEIIDSAGLVTCSALVAILNVVTSAGVPGTACSDALNGRTHSALMQDLKNGTGLFNYSWASIGLPPSSVYLQIIQFQTKARCHRRPRICAPSALLT